MAFGAERRLLDLLQQDEVTLIARALGALRGLAYERPPIAACLVSAGVVPLLTELLEHPEPEVVEGSTKLIQFLACCDEVRLQVGAGGAVERLVALLRLPEEAEERPEEQRCVYI